MSDTEVPDLLRQALAAEVKKDFRRALQCYSRAANLALDNGDTRTAAVIHILMYTPCLRRCLEHRKRSSRTFTLVILVAWVLVVVFMSFLS